jgi:hypothetical protein
MYLLFASLNVIIHVCFAQSIVLFADTIFELVGYSDTFGSYTFKGRVFITSFQIFTYKFVVHSFIPDNFISLFQSVK